MTKGQRIRSRREELNIGQTELANKIQVSKQTLYKYENDIVTNIPSDKIEMLARELQTTPEYIMGWNEPRTSDYVISSEDVNVAIDMYERYKGATPEARAAIELLLGFHVSDS